MGAAGLGESGVKKSRDADDYQERISVMLVDDDPSFLRITEKLLKTRYSDKIDVVGTAKSGEECLTLAQLLAPEVVLIDLHMPGIGGLGTIPLLHILFPQTHVIALSSDEGDRPRRLVLAAGGQDLISKCSVRTHLFPAIQRAMKDDTIPALALGLSA
jgi:DNA-binding NarL/FixJ family response regulator